jgi:hypothetical protein
MKIYPVQACVDGILAKGAKDVKLAKTMVKLCARIFLIALASLRPWRTWREDRTTGASTRVKVHALSKKIIYPGFS